jgi:hypothetical protein
MTMTPTTAQLPVAFAPGDRAQIHTRRMARARGADSSGGITMYCSSKPLAGPRGCRGERPLGGDENVSSGGITTYCSSNDSASGGGSIVSTSSGGITTYCRSLSTSAIAFCQRAGCGACTSSSGAITTYCKSDGIGTGCGVSNKPRLLLPGDTAAAAAVVVLVVLWRNDGVLRLALESSKLLRAQLYIFERAALRGVARRQRL